MSYFIHFNLWDPFLECQKRCEFWTKWVFSLTTLMIIEFGINCWKIRNQLVQVNIYQKLFIELQVQCLKIPSLNLGRTCCVQKLFLTFRTIFVYNMFSQCSAKRRASDKDLPVQKSEDKLGIKKNHPSMLVESVWIMNKYSVPKLKKNIRKKHSFAF